MMKWMIVLLLVNASFVQPHAVNSQNINRNEELNLMEERIFYVLELMENMPEIDKIMHEAAGLSNIAQDKKERMLNALNSTLSLNSLTESFLIDSQQTALLTKQLCIILDKNQIIKRKLITEIRRSGKYAIVDRKSDTSSDMLLKSTLSQTVGGINYIIEAYLKNKGLAYPDIDSTSYDVHGKKYLSAVKHLAFEALADTNLDRQLFFQPLTNICLHLLLLNGRDEAVRYWPLDQSNEAPYHLLNTVHWVDFPFSCILVCGAGPEQPNVAISEDNKKRCRAAAEQLRLKKAPFIIVSGGFVHPFQTAYCEAVEMRRFLMDSLSIAASQIIIEPHARHTTTNIRNVNRIIYDKNIPADKPVLGVSSSSHIDYISAVVFRQVCLRDLKYLPFERLQKMSDHTISFYPVKLSQKLNERDPLDP